MANLQSRQLQAGFQVSKKTPAKVTFGSRCSLVRFCGFGMKLLLTSVYQATYGISFLNSSLLATGSLVLFAAVRIAMPLISRLVPLMSVITATLFITGILYASYPAVIANLSVWWLLAAKSAAGACFAGLNCLGPLLLLEVYSASDLPVVCAATGPARALGWGLGPVVGYYIHLASKESGIAIQQSYNPFFYICAAMTFFVAFNVAWLRRNLLRRQAKAASGAC